MVEAADIDWDTINTKLPYERSDEAKNKRRELFNQFDPNCNGYLSLAEVLQTSEKNLYYCKKMIILISTYNTAFSKFRLRLIRG